MDQSRGLEKDISGSKKMSSPKLKGATRNRQQEQHHKQEKNHTKLEVKNDEKKIHKFTPCNQIVFYNKKKATREAL